MLHFIGNHYIAIALAIALIAVFIHDINSKKHTILHNFPVVGHLRFLMEKIGPELRQYWVANNRDELPFPRRWRDWIYASSKTQNNLTGFGTDMDLMHPGHVIIKNSMIPYHDGSPAKYPYDFIPCAKVMGEGRRKRPYRPKSIVNISGMSFGALSAAAVEALNGGARIAECYQNTGEGGYSQYHDKFKADVIFQVGTGYFGVCDSDGNFQLDKLVQLVHDHPNIRAIEVKLSQGAKPGKGGILPAAKMTREIADARGLPVGKDSVSPSYHKEFSDVKGLIDFVEKIAEATGLPVGIKSAIGQLGMWRQLFMMMQDNDKGPDFITIDGGEGGTGAAPPSFTDHLSLPFDRAFTAVHDEACRFDLTDRIVFIGSGKLGLPANSIKAFAMGADVVNVGREALLSIGCIQAQRCHTNRCPSGIATQNKWLSAGLDPALKSQRAGNYIKALRKEIMDITHAAGYRHPSEFTHNDVSISNGTELVSLKNYTKFPKPKVAPKVLEPMQSCTYL